MPVSTPASTSIAAEPLILANAKDRYVVTADDLPLACPMPDMTLWNSHPRVYLAIEDEGGESMCPYCGAHFVLTAEPAPKPGPGEPAG